MLKGKTVIELTDVKTGQKKYMKIPIWLPRQSQMC